MISNLDNEVNYPYKLLLAERQVPKLCKDFANGLSANIKLWKTGLSKMKKSGGFFDRLLWPLLKTVLRLTENVIQPLAKRVLIHLGLTAAVSTADTGIQRKIFEPGDPRTYSLGTRTTTLLVSSEEMADFKKKIKSLKESSLLIKRLSESFENESKEQKGAFLSMLLGTLGTATRLFKNSIRT